MGLFHKIFRIIPKKKVTLLDLNLGEQERNKIVEISSGMEYPILERELFPGKIICPCCGSTLLEGTDFCTYCNADLWKSQSNE